LAKLLKGRHNFGGLNCMGTRAGIQKNSGSGSPRSSKKAWDIS